MSRIWALGDLHPTFPEDGSHFIGAHATIVGDVRLGRNVGIWYGCTLRGDIEPITIGDDTNIQELSVAHTEHGYPLWIGAGVTIGHRALVHGCTIEDNVLVGMGAIIMNGAYIGKNTIIGAGALVTENKKIPEGSLVLGAPARVVRMLDESEIAGIRQSARNYITYKVRIQKDARPLD